jgi:hypothetical protein
MITEQSIQNLYVGYSILLGMRQYVAQLQTASWWWKIYLVLLELIC